MINHEFIVRKACKNNHVAKNDHVLLEFVSIYCSIAVSIICAGVNFDERVFETVLSISL